MPSQQDGSNQKPTLPSFQSLLRDIDELGPLEPAAGVRHRHDTARSLSSTRSGYSDRYPGFTYADSSHSAGHLSPAQLPSAPHTTWRPEARQDATPSPRLSSYGVDHPSISEGLRASAEARASPATRMHAPTRGVSPSSTNSRGRQSARADDATWRVNLRRQDESPVDSDLTTFTGQMSMHPSVDSASSKLGTAGPDGRLAKYICSYCGKRFNRPSSLKIHNNIHTGDRPYVCSVPGCERTFSVLSNMRRHTKTHGISHTAAAAAPPSANAESKNKRRPPTKQDIDDELVDELEDDITDQPPREQPSHLQMPSNSAKRRKMRGAGESTRPYPSRGGVIPEISHINSPTAIGSTVMSGFDSGSEGDDLDELLGDGPRRQGRKLDSPVYTSSDDSDSEKQARAHAKAPRHTSTEEYAPASTIKAATAEVLMVAAGPPISVLRKPPEFHTSKPQGSGGSQSSGFEDADSPRPQHQPWLQQPGTFKM